MMTLKGRMSHHDAPVPAHVVAIMEAKAAALAARIAAQEAARAEQPAFSPVTVGVTKRLVRSRNYRKG